MATLEELISRRDALEEARASGIRSVRTGPTTVEYRSDADMQAALRSLEAQIAALQGRSVLPFGMIEVFYSRR